MKYTVLLERESEGVFVACVPMLPGCVSQGDTREQAPANIREAMDLYIEDMLANGEDLPAEGAHTQLEVRATPV